VIHVPQRAASGQEPAKHVLPLPQRKRPQVVALEAEQVEGEVGGPQRALRGAGHLLGTAQHQPLLHSLEVRAARLVHHHHLAVQDHVTRQRAKRRRHLGEGDGRVGSPAVAQSGAPVLVPGQEAEPVVLQLEDPALAVEGGRRGGQHQTDVGGPQGPGGRAQASQLPGNGGAQAGHGVILARAWPRRTALKSLKAKAPCNTGRTAYPAGDPGHAARCNCPYNLRTFSTSR